MSERTTSELLIGSELQQAARKVDELQTNFYGDGRQDLINKVMSAMEAGAILFLKNDFANERESKLIAEIAEAIANLEVGAINSAVCAYQRYCDYSKKDDEGEESEEGNEAA